MSVAHLVDYLDALKCGRLNGNPRPVVRHDRRAVVTVEADDGVAQLAFRAARPALSAAARECGAAVLSVSGAFTMGELGTTPPSWRPGGSSRWPGPTPRP